MKKNKISRKMRSFFRNKKFLFAAMHCENKSYSCYQNWYFPLSKIFNNILFFDPQKNLSHYGKEEMNKRLLELVDREKPDYIFFWLLYSEFYPETLLKIREISPKTIIFNLFGDDDSQFNNFSRYYAPLFDYILMHPQLTAKTYKKEGLKNFSFTNGVSINLDNFKFLNIKKKYDISFIGSPKIDRYDLIKFLLDNKMSIRLFGPGWYGYKDLEGIYGGQLDYKDIVKVINQSKINLCFSKNQFGVPHLKEIVFEVAACKAFPLVDYSPPILRFFEDNKEIVSFKNKKELLEKVRYYLEHEKEREKIAGNAYKKMIKNYSMDLLIKNFLTLIFKQKTFKHKPLPEIKAKRVIISKDDINSADLKDKIKNAAYISFTENSEDLPYKNYFQAYSLEKSGKQVSCCDYYVHSNSLGDYLMFMSNSACKTLDKKKFSKLLNINQLMVTKKYLLKNIRKFREIFNGKSIDFVDEKSTVFVSIPLVRVENLKVLDYDDMKKAFEPKFMNMLNAFIYQRSMKAAGYLYNLFMLGIFKNGFVLEYLYRALFNKNKLRTLKKSITR